MAFLQRASNLLWQKIRGSRDMGAKNFPWYAYRYPFIRNRTAKKLSSKFFQSFWRFIRTFFQKGSYAAGGSPSPQKNY
jgi:hypothetical protein